MGSIFMCWQPSLMVFGIQLPGPACCVQHHRDGCPTPEDLVTAGMLAHDALIAPTASKGNLCPHLEEAHCRQCWVSPAWVRRGCCCLGVVAMVCGPLPARRTTDVCRMMGTFCEWGAFLDVCQLRSPQMDFTPSRLLGPLGGLPFQGGHDGGLCWPRGQGVKELPTTATMAAWSGSGPRAPEFTHAAALVMDGDRAVMLSFMALRSEYWAVGSGWDLGPLLPRSTC